MSNIDKFTTSQSDLDLEKEIVEKNLTAPRVTLDAIKSKITDVEYVVHQTNGGSILRWCVISMANGFSVTGEPSAAVSRANDNAEIGEKIAFDNAFSRIWALEGYLLKEMLYADS